MLQYKSLNKKQGIIRIAKATIHAFTHKQQLKRNRLKTHTATNHIYDYLLLLSI